MKKNVLTIIPVRLASTRLPNKPLADIVGKSMIQRVYEQACKADLGEVVIACDGLEIAKEVEKFGGKYVLTDPDLPSGTDRIFAAYEKIASEKEFDIVLNLQGDLPTIDPKVIVSAAEAAFDEGCDFATVASKITNENEINNPNVVKIAIAFKQDDLGRALYFSRAAIPYSEKSEDYFHHIGIYAYKAKALEKFVSLRPSNLEKRESLEQLRALENDMKINVKIVDAHPLSVDTQEDLDVIINLVKHEEN
ncbi:MAG: 3-deoxy-manno-octulosonate cytidylyltransferase [Rickettsiales bacterium]|nr:3-deoxy-manno-octulosonate cytidylyltransferase [Rickettsiales bacterium]